MILEPLLNNLFRFSEQHGNIFLNVEAVADEERHDRDVFGLGQFIARGDARVFFEKHRMHCRIKVLGAEQLDLPFRGLPGFVVLFRAMSGDDERQVLWFRGAGKGELLDDFASAAEEDGGHAVVGAGRLAVKQPLAAAFEDTARALWTPQAEAKGFGNYLFAKVAFADKKRHEECQGCFGLRNNLGEKGRLFPKGLADFGEWMAAAQFTCLPAHCRGGILIERCSVAEKNQG